MGEMMSIEIMNKVYSFIDAIQTITPKASFYNTKDQRVSELKKIHNQIKDIDEDLYKLFLFYPGINDYNKLNIMGSVLSQKSMSFLTMPVVTDDVKELLAHDSFISILRNTSYARVLRFFLELKERKVNNKRLKKTVLNFILRDPKLISRSVKYRTKIRDLLTHVYGLKTSSLLCSFLSLKAGSSPSIEKTLRKEVYRYSSLSKEELKDFFMFVFKVPVTEYSVEIYTVYKEAHKDIEKGSSLPYETLLGIRNAHYKDYDLKNIFEKTSKTMTKSQKITLQRSSEKRGVKISTDFSGYDSVKLYKYAYERGWSEEIKQAIDKSVRKSLSKFQMDLKDICLVVDNSQSMEGRSDSKNDPISRVMSISKFLELSSESCKYFFTGKTENTELPTVGGESSLGRTLIRALKEKPDTVFILSDGYENAPEGMTDLVIKGVQKIGLNTNIVHINPVFAAESSKVRSLSNKIATLPLYDLNQLEGIFMKSLLEKNSLEGIKFLKKFLFVKAYKHFGISLSDELKKEIEDQSIIDFQTLL